MFSEPSLTASSLQQRLVQFFAEHIEPNDAAYHEQLAENRRRGQPFAAIPLIESLQQRARHAGLWNLFLPPDDDCRGDHGPADPGHADHGRKERDGAGLTNLEYAPLCEIMGRLPWSAEVFNCAAPDTGNMETLARYGTADQQRQWLEPLASGRIRSAFLMSEPAVASSDATNIACRIERHGDEYRINGRKWWSTGANHPHCRLLLVMGKTDPQAARHQQQSILLVPADAPGVQVLRHLTVFGYDDAPHGHAEVALQDVRVPVSNLLGAAGCGFEIAQARLGPGRVHHCMRSIGVAERALAMMCRRLEERTAFGERLARRSVWHERIARARCLIDQARLLVLHTAHRMDIAGNRAARKEIAMIKSVVPASTLQVLDWAIQAYGAAGVSDDFALASLWASQRAMRIFDGPDEVHANSIAKLELAQYRAPSSVNSATAAAAGAG